MLHSTSERQVRICMIVISLKCGRFGYGIHRKDSPTPKTIDGTLTKVMKARPLASAMRSLGMLSAPSMTLSDVKFSRVLAAFRISPTMSNVTGELRYLQQGGIDSNISSNTSTSGVSIFNKSGSGSDSSSSSGSAIHTVATVVAVATGVLTVEVAVVLLMVVPVAVVVAVVAVGVLLILWHSSSSSNRSIGSRSGSSTINSIRSSST